MQPFQIDAPPVVSPKKAMELLDCGRTKLYELINAGELETYRDGKSRKITARSIRERIDRKLKEALVAA